MPFSKNQIKNVNSLQIKKNRYKTGCFVAEGIKVVDEFLDSGTGLEAIYCTEDVVYKYDKLNPTVITEQELTKVSSFKNPNKVLAVFKMFTSKLPKSKGLKVVLDDINDPGNLGTIIRLCDWFGVEELVCSKNTVDCYNSKVVQSTMGSLSRVSVNYTNLIEFLKATDQPIYVADMDGKNIYATTLPENGVIIMGNEANGVSKEIKELIDHKISIPRFGTLQQTESLNVATATSIILSEFRRIIGKLR
ncbi:TrmH family RNA methyltransferase [Wenyingzhuangia sp. IMCC45533]